LNFIHAKKILDILKRECVRQNTPNLNALELFNRETHNAKDMSTYRNMLKTAIQTALKDAAAFGTVSGSTGDVDVEIYQSNRLKFWT